MHTTALLTKYDPKKFPKLKTLQVAARRRTVVQSPDDMLALVKMMNTALGGVVVKVDNIPMH